MVVTWNKKKKQYQYSFNYQGKRYRRTNEEWIRGTKDIVAEKEKKHLEKLKSGISEIKNVSFRELCDLYIEYISLGKDKSSTIRSKRVHINKHLIPFFDKINIKNISVRTLDKFQAELSTKTYKPKKNSEEILYSNGSIEKTQHILNSIFTFAVSRGYMTFNPFSQSHVVTRRSYNPPKERKVVEPNDFKKFIAIIDEEISSEAYDLNSENRVYAIIDKALYLTVAWIGCRPGEALALNISDYNTETRIFSINSNWNAYDKEIVTTKTDKTRKVYAPKLVHDAVLAMLEIYPKQFVNANSPLFGGIRRLPHTSLKNRRIKYCEKAGIELFSLLDLRHTNVSLLSHMGFEDVEIAERTGHSVEVLNKHYKHVMPQKKKESNEKLDELATFGQFLGNYKEKEPK